MIRIRCNERFTYPAEFRSLVLQNMDIIRPYFHKNIIYFGMYMHCSLSADSVRTDKALSELVLRLMHIIENRGFEAVCFIDRKKSEKILKKGIEADPEITFRMPFDPAGLSNETAAVKCVICFRDFSKSCRIPFIIEMIKSVSYYALERYDYPFQFEGACIGRITAKRIVEIIE